MIPLSKCFLLLLVTFINCTSALSLEDERRQIATSIIGFLCKVFCCYGNTFLYCWLQIDFGKDFEQQLSFYVEVRATFSNLDPVLMYLIQVSNLIVR